MIEKTMDPRREKVFNFIVARFDGEDYERAINYDDENDTFQNLFPTYWAFQQYQLRVVDALDETNLMFAVYLVSYIERSSIELEYGVIPFRADGFYYRDGRIVISNQR
jgi:hypothetical protein